MKREADAEAEVSDEDESAEVNESQSSEKPKKSGKLKLSQSLSDIVTMKSVHFGGTQEIPSGMSSMELWDKKSSESVFTFIKFVMKNHCFIPVSLVKLGG